MNPDDSNLVDDDPSDEVDSSYWEWVQRYLNTLEPLPTEDTSVEIPDPIV